MNASSTYNLELLNTVDLNMENSNHDLSYYENELDLISGSKDFMMMEPDTFVISSNNDDNEWKFELPSANNELGDDSDGHHLRRQDGTQKKTIFLSNAVSSQQEPEVGLEPRPIAPDGITFVDKVEYNHHHLNNVPFDDTLVDFLRTVFGDEGGSNLLQQQQEQGKEQVYHPDLSQQVSSSSVVVVDRGEPLKPVGVNIVSEPEDTDGSITSSSTTSGNSHINKTSSTRGASFRSNQLEQWNQRFLEMIEFKETYSHCSVPLHWPQNPSLAHWVKRQRHQYRMKTEGKHSTMTSDRQAALEELGFVWDSHAATWEERLGELRKFRDQRDHCRVPKKYPENQQLAVWVKCQRRQFKLYSEGKDSNMTVPRLQKLYELGFDFSPRSKQRTSAVSLAIAQLAANNAAAAAAVAAAAASS